MRRAVVGSAASAAGIVLLLSLDSLRTVGPAVIGSGGSEAPRAATGPSGTAVPSPEATATTGGGTRSVTGDAVNTRYGPVQVRVTLSGSRITGVEVVEYPTDNRRDREINGSALPLLNREATAAQSAAIDVVSGATYTSQGYIRSLQSALDRAGR
ncbi:FMN-binding protein [Kitasatospora sp. NPDC057965]|uniref:FMN-binding protein n=1 Tax=Kitasatospora sp. NPDC057965 TaxID=3346291 RepID=UPI0036DEA474